jgi:hypothetical protein
MVKLCAKTMNNVFTQRYKYFVEGNNLEKVIEVTRRTAVP